MYIMRGKRLKHIHVYTIICNKIFLITDRLTFYLYLHIYFVLRFFFIFIDHLFYFNLLVNYLSLQFLKCNLVFFLLLFQFLSFCC